MVLLLCTTEAVQCGLKRSENQVRNSLTSISEIALSMQSGSLCTSGGTSSGHSLTGQLFVSVLNSSHFFPQLYTSSFKGFIVVAFQHHSQHS